jgi:hypothetical protein
MLRGARSKLEQVQGVGTRDPVVIDVPFDAKPGPMTIQVAEILDRDPRFTGLTWQQDPRSTPGTVEVYVDPLEEHVLPVQVRKQDEDRLVAGGGGAVFTPANVKVRLPRRVAGVARDARGDDQLVAYADLGALRDTADGGKQKLSDVRVLVDGTEQREEVTIEPATVSAVVTLRDVDQTHKIAAIPVVPLPSSASFHEQYAVSLAPATLFDVEVIGTPQAIGKLRDKGDAEVRAYVSLSPDDEGKDEERRVSFILPDSVRLLHPDSPDHKVRITVVARDPDGG